MAAGRGVRATTGLTVTESVWGAVAVAVPYRNGTMLFTGNEHWHRIAASRSGEPSLGALQIARKFRCTPRFVMCECYCHSRTERRR